jgi:hypothetical protein
MPESLQSKIMRLKFLAFPCYVGTGARVTYIAGDYKEVRVRLPLSWRTRNYVGTIYGGSMYGAVDPIFMLMLMKILGPEYIVWDKAASIRFKKPGRGTLYARFTIDDAEIAAIHEGLGSEKSLDRVYQLQICDKAGEVHAIVEKTVYIRKK